jgi:glycerol-3-phosphate acyltransferase PlsY
VFLGLAPWAVLCALGVWVAVMSASRMVSLASIAAAATLPLFVRLLPHSGGLGLLAFTVALGLMVIWAHRTNIRRILRGEESRFGRPGTPEVAP